MRRIIAITLVLIMLFPLAGCGEEEVEVVPNEHFGMVEAEYSLTTALPLDGGTGNTDLLAVNSVYLTQPTSEYYEYIGRTNPENNALVLNLGVTVAEGFDAGITSRQYERWEIIEESSNPEYLEGFVEKLEGGEWTIIAALDIPKETIGQANVSTALEPFVCLTEGEQILSTPFPVHEPGEYRITIYFRECIRTPLGNLVYTTGTEQYSVTQALTIPEPSGNKFDLIQVGFVEDAWGSPYYTFSALLRSNDGSIPCQDLLATRLEIFTSGGWSEAPASDFGYGYTSAVVQQYDSKTGPFSASAYPTTHPFTDEAVDNLFCGTAKFAVTDPTLPHRLTLEFVENADGSGERYVLQIPLSFAVPE